MHPLARTAVSAAAALVMLVGLVGLGGQAQAAPADLVRPTAKQQVYWKWSDGSQSTRRVFREARYVRAGRLPRLVVTAVPAKPSRAVVLQFKEKGKWLVETKSATNAKGVAVLKLDPYCTNRTWCDGTWTYRIKVGTLYQVLKVTYRGR